MDEQENQEQNQEQSLEEKVMRSGKNKLEQLAKDSARQVGKQAGKAVATALTTVISAIISKFGILIAGVIIGGVLLSSLTSYQVKKDIVDIGSVTTDRVMEIIEIGDDGLVIPSKNEAIAFIDEQLENLNIDKKDLLLGNENQANEYLYKYMVASLSTRLPYIEGTTVKNMKDIYATNTMVDADAKQAVQGIVKIKRKSEDGTPRYLTFKKYEDFTKLIEQDNENNTKTALDYFSINDSWQLCVAKYNKTTVTKQTTSQTGDTVTPGQVNTTVDMTVSEVKIPYQNMISQYSIAFEFLLTLQQVSQNAEYVSAVADLLMEESYIEFTIFDSTEIRTTDYTYQYDIVERWQEEVVVQNPQPIEGGTNTGGTNAGSISTIAKNNPYRVTTRSQTNSRQIELAAKVPETERFPTIVEPTPNPPTQEEENNEENTTETPPENTEPETTWVMRESIETVIENTVTVSEINTVTANVTSADVWILQQITAYTNNTLEPEYPLKEEGVTTPLEGDKIPEGAQEGKWTINKQETTKEKVVKNEWEAGETNSDLNPSKFLGLWKNSTGTYVQGADYVSDGIIVQYNKPGSTKKESPIGNIFSSKEMICDLLNTEATQKQVQLMEYVFYYWETGKKLAIDLSIFNPSEFTGVSTIMGGTIQEKVWFTLKSAGFSDESIAGAMGNIHFESGSFDPTKVEDGFTEDNGGIGICQWTNDDRGPTGRNTQLKAYAASKGKTWQDEDIQVEFLLTEITGTGEALGFASKQFSTRTYAGSTWEKTAWEEAQGATTDEKIENATKAFCYTFERPGESDAIASMTERIEYARMYYKQFAGSVIRYYQNDYPDVKFGSSTLAYSGCGPTSFAMVATRLSGKAITPPEAIAWCGNSYYVPGEGIDWDYFAAAAKHFGLSYTVRQTSNFADAENALKIGKLVICSQSKGLFTNNGHIIVLTKMENGLIYVNDPNKNNAVNKGYNDRAFTTSEITQAAKQYWIFE